MSRRYITVVFTSAGKLETTYAMDSLSEAVRQSESDLEDSDVVAAGVLDIQSGEFVDQIG